MKKEYKILGVGHPRTGTGYTSKLLQSWGLNVGHEELLDDGIIAWQFVIPKPIVNKNTLPWIGTIPHTEINFDTIIYNVRNPKNSIPSIINTENASINYRSTWCPISENKNVIENAIVSIVWTDMRILEMFPNCIIYRVEDQQDYLFENLKSKYQIRESKDAVSKEYNKKRDYNKDIDWESVRPKYRKIINDFCIKYGYDPIY